MAGNAGDTNCNRVPGCTSTEAAAKYRNVPVYRNMYGEVCKKLFEHLLYFGEPFSKVNNARGCYEGPSSDHK